MTMPVRVVAISRTSGAEGEAVGRIVSDGLGFRYVDEEIVTTVAERQGVHPDLVADAEKRKGLLARLVEGLGKVGADTSVAYTIPVSLEMGRSDDFRALILDTITETAEEGDVVIVAHAASMALAGRDDLLRVLVTASPETRAGRLAGATGLSEKEAAKTVKDSDSARADYLRRFHRIERELPSHYDLVVNTDVLSPDQAAELIVMAARR
jgi:Cytidylate kinase-like family